MRHNLESLLYDFIVDNNIATVDEVELVTNINGYSEESLNDIIHCRTEYHDVPQLYACEPEGYYFSDELLEEYDLLDEEEDEEEETELYSVWVGDGEITDNYMEDYEEAVELAKVWRDEKGHKDTCIEVVNEDGDHKRFIAEF